MEYLQVQSGEDEDSAWRRMRPKLGTGKHLDETILLLPQAVPAAAGAGATNGGVVIVTGLPVTPPPGGQGGPFPPVVTGSGTGAPPPVPTPTTHSAPATSAVNLIGQLEKWGIGPATQVREVTLRVDAATGAQLQKLLRGLPDGLIYDLNLKKEEG
jgi:hypothetical protein